nr:MAG TPA_asm: hypothetical protein [Caudoviricetes sp.]
MFISFKLDAFHTIQSNSLPFVRTSLLIIFLCTFYKFIIC